MVELREVLHQLSFAATTCQGPENIATLRRVPRTQGLPKPQATRSVSERPDCQLRIKQRRIGCWSRQRIACGRSPSWLS
jgi:hypothetical protein